MFTYTLYPGRPYKYWFTIKRDGNEALFEEAYAWCVEQFGPTRSSVWICYRHTGASLIICFDNIDQAMFFRLRWG